MSFLHFKSHITVNDEKIPVIVSGTKDRFYQATYYQPSEGGEFHIKEIEAVNPADNEKIPDLAHLDEADQARFESEGYEW